LKAISVYLLAGVLASLCACRSDEGSGGFPSDVWKSGVFQRAPLFASRCAAPRHGSSAVTGQPFPDVQGKALDERNWLRSWTHEFYLWYSEVPDVDPANYETLEYFDLMKTPAVAASGEPKDKFHFTYPTAQWEAISQAGEQAGYGFHWELVAPTVPRRVVIAYVEPAAPAETLASGVARGDELIFVDGITVESTTVPAEIEAMNAALFPPNAGQTHNFILRDTHGATRSITLTSAVAPAAAVMNVKTIATGAGIVGYLQFNNHVVPAEQALIDAVNTLKAANNGAGIDDLVLDIRYNGGGLLDLASEIAYMVAGPTPTAGRTFEQAQFNDKFPATNPVTGDSLKPIPFYSQALGYSAPTGTALPSLNLSRVFVLTGEGTCSASESIINSLRGIDFQVIQIGSTSCGKPYGFYPTDNCGTTYFSVQFKGVNAKNFGDYGDGYSPENTAGAAGEPVPGCSVADDFVHELGDTAEGLFAVALSYRQGVACPNPTGQSVGGGRVQTQSLRSQLAPGGALQRPFWRENRIIH
jgi:hypothetical protein